MDQDFAIRRFIDPGDQRLPAEVDPAVFEELLQHEGGVLGDVEGVVDLFAGSPAVDFGQGIGVDVVESRDYLVLELEEVGLLLRGFAPLGEPDEDCGVGADGEDCGGSNVFGRAIEDVFECTHLIMLS